MIVLAAVPAGNGFTYSGRLEQNNNPPTAFFDFEFGLFDDPNGISGSEVSETLFFDHLKVHKGSFNVRLDFGEDAFDGNARWLLISVREDNENDPNAFEDLLPLVQLTPAPYALSAKKIGGKELADLIQKSEPNSIGASMITKGSITREKIGTGAVSREKLENGAVNSSKIENKAVGQGQLNDKAVGQGQLGDKAVGRGQIGNKAVGKGQLDDAAVDPNKLEDGAVTTAKLGDISGYQLSSNYAGYLMSLSNDGTTGSGDDGDGIYVYSKGAAAIKGKSNGPFTQNGFGVFGENLSGDGTGVYGYALGGRGLWGKSDGTTGTGYGVYGENTADGTGVYGYSSGGDGVYGKSEGSDGIGVYGENTAGGWAAKYEGKSMFRGGLYVTDSSTDTDPLEALHVDGQVLIDGMNSGSGNLVYIKGNGRLVQQTSSARYKENIQPLDDDFNKILQAESKSFVRKGTGEREIGFIAEEFDALGLNNLVIYKDGKPNSVRYEMVPLYLLEMAKDMAETTDQLKQENQLLKQQMRSLQDAFEDFKSSMAQEVE